MEVRLFPKCMYACESFTRGHIHMYVHYCMNRYVPETRGRTLEQIEAMLRKER